MCFVLFPVYIENFMNSYRIVENFSLFGEVIFAYSSPFLSTLTESYVSKQSKKIDERIFFRQKVHINVT